MRRAAKRDTTEKAIVEALRACGWSVLRLSQKDAPDLLIARPGGATALVEVKTGKKPLRKGQAEFAATWPTAVYVLRSVEDVVQLAKGAR